MSDEKLLAYHGDPAVKAKYLGRVKAHQLADEITQGIYWESGKGCAVGCTIHGSDHERYETELGIPFQVAVLEDAIFEGLPNTDAKLFPLRFLEAIPVGADLSLVWPKFVAWAMLEGDGALIKLFDKVDLAKLSEDDAKTFADGRAAFEEIANMYKQWGDTGIEPSPNARALARALDRARALALALDLDRALALALG